MIRISQPIYIGTSKDAEHEDLAAHGINALLNVAHDLKCVRAWPQFTYAQCGIIDGPGNTMSSYYSAVMMLASFVLEGKRTMVYCHNGGRSLAIVLMYLTLTGGYNWDEWLKLLREANALPDPNPEHKKMYDKINWKALSSAF